MSFGLSSSWVLPYVPLEEGLIGSSAYLVDAEWAREC